MLSLITLRYGFQRREDMNVKRDLFQQFCEIMEHIDKRKFQRAKLA